MTEGERADGGRDSWVERLRAALGDGHGDLIEFLATGRSTNAAITPEAERRSNDRLGPQWLANSWREQAWRDALDSVDWLTLTIAMDPEALGRLGGLFGAGRRSAGWLGCVLGSHGRAMSLARVVEAGAWLGYGRDDVVLEIFGSDYRPWDTGDVAEWLGVNAGWCRSVVGPLVQLDPSVWKRVLWGGARLATVLLPEAIEAGTGSSQQARMAARPVVEAIGYVLTGPALRDVAVSGNSSQRGHAIELLGEIVPAQLTTDLGEWLQQRCADDRAASVRDVATRVLAAIRPAARPSRSESVDFDVALPSGFEERLAAMIALDRQSGRHLESPPERAAQIVAVLENRSRTIVRWGIAEIVVKDRTHVDGLATVHWARLLRAVGTSGLGGAVVGSMRAGRGPTPVDLQTVAAHDGVSPTVVHEWVTGRLGSDEASWPRAQVAAWVASEELALVRRLTEPEQRYDDGVSRRGLFVAFACVDVRSDVLHAGLLNSALAGYKADQPEARRLLGGLLGSAVVAEVCAALRSKRLTERVGAASWLRELADRGAAPALRSAIDAEHHDTAKAAMLLALEACGGSLNDYFAADTLLDEAITGLARRGAMPEALNWFDFDAQPRVHWNDGSLVDIRVVQWFCASAIDANWREPSAMLRLCVAAMNAAEARVFGAAVLAEWISYDERPAPDDGSGWSPAPQARESRNLLMVVAAMAGPELVAPTVSYVTTWYGMRVHQCKTMIRLLAWIDDPTAVRSLLTIGQRFRTKSIQQEAIEQLELLAARRGWSVDELADLTVSRCGLDDDGSLHLDYGTRSFTAHLHDDLTLRLTSDTDGAHLKTLPAARTDEDETVVSALQRELQTTRKELKTTIAAQTVRLREAMMAERRWTAAEYTTNILDHPVTHRIAARLVWISTLNDDDHTFRPTHPGALLDSHDHPIALDDRAEVRLAHDALVDNNTVDQWKQRLATGTVAPLFAQFGRPAPIVDGSVLDVVDGWTTTGLRLRGAINKHGWRYGNAEAGGMTMRIERNVVPTGLVAVLGLTDTPLYADDQPVTFQQLWFRRRNASPHGPPLPISDVPAVMLHEILADVLQIAAATSTTTSKKPKT